MNDLPHAQTYATTYLAAITAGIQDEDRAPGPRRLRWAGFRVDAAMGQRGRWVRALVGNVRGD